MQGETEIPEDPTTFTEMASEAASSCSMDELLWAFLSPSPQPEYRNEEHDISVTVNCVQILVK